MDTERAGITKVGHKKKILKQKENMSTHMRRQSVAEFPAIRDLPTVKSAPVAPIGKLAVSSGDDRSRMAPLHALRSDDAVRCDMRCDVCRCDLFCSPFAQSSLLFCIVFAPFFAEFSRTHFLLSFSLPSLSCFRSISVCSDQFVAAHFVARRSYALFLALF